MLPNPFLPTFKHNRSCETKWPKNVVATFVILKNLPKVNNDPMGEKSHNLVTLLGSVWTNGVGTESFPPHAKKIPHLFKLFCLNLFR
jgi:hypothetical protein